MRRLDQYNSIHDYTLYIFFVLMNSENASHMVVHEIVVTMVTCYKRDYTRPWEIGGGGSGAGEPGSHYPVPYLGTPKLQE